MEKLKQFFKESYDEVYNNVTWPTMSELQQSSILVLVASLIFALLVGLMDFSFKFSLEAIYSTIRG
jgi:preprotein translocase subunit SecE